MTAPPSVLGDPEDPWSYHKETVPADVPVRLLPQLVQLANSEDPKDQLQGTLLIRKLLCAVKDPPIDVLVQRLVSFLLRDDFADLQLEATRTVRKIACGATSHGPNCDPSTSAHTGYVMEQGAVPHFIRLLNSPSEAIRAQAAAALGNMAGDSAACRDYILGLGVMAPLLQCITAPADVSVLRNGVWAVANLCRSKPKPDLDTVCQALPVIVPLLAHDDEETVASTCWALFHISDGPPADIERVLNTGALPEIIRLLTSVHASQQTPATRIVGNLAGSNGDHTQLLVSSGALSSFHALLKHPRRAIRKEACFALSNITAGTPEQMQAVIDEELFPDIIQCIDAAEYDIKKEALWCVCNLSAGGTPEQIRYVVEELHVFGNLVPVLAVLDSGVLKVALETLDRLLDAGEGEKQRRGLTKNPYLQMCIDNRGFSHLAALESHSNNDVYYAANNIIDAFFDRADGAAA